MGPNPVTKCVTILAVFHADCFIILPDLADESFPHCQPSTSSLSDCNCTHHPEKKLFVFVSFRIFVSAVYRSGRKLAHHIGLANGVSTFTCTLRQVCLRRDGDLRDLLQSAEVTAIAASYSNYCIRSRSPISRAGLKKA